MDVRWLIPSPLKKKNLKPRVRSNSGMSQAYRAWSFQQAREARFVLPQRPERVTAT